MRAYVYVMKQRGNWRAYLTIEPQVDYTYWLAGGWGAASGERGWCWREPLPLGQACRVVERWTSAAIEDEEALRRLGILVASVTADIGEAQLAREGRRRMEFMHEEHDGEKKGSDRELGKAGRRRGRQRQRSDAAGARAALWLPAAERAGQDDAAGGGALSAARQAELAATAKLAAALLQGRALLSAEARDLLAGAALPGAEASWSGAFQLASLLGLARLGSAIAPAAGGRSQGLRCRRCGSGEAQMRRTACLACGASCAYCEACLGMGRSKECELLIRGRYVSAVWDSGVAQGASVRRIAPPASIGGIDERLEKWSLSPAQREAAAKALQFVEASPPSSSRARKQSWLRRALRNPLSSEMGGSLTPGFASSSLPAPPKQIRNFLLWAVTGAGKTEMIFPLIDSVLLRGGHVLIASPRRDVVIELDPRIRAAFPEASVVTLYGGSKQKWERGQITLSTTHQLLRFCEAFDLVIVDEIDAFPYAGDPLLHYAADNACLPDAPRLLLSATPPRELQRAAKRGLLAHARVPVRYHLNPLPVPSLLRSPGMNQILATGKLPQALQHALRQSLERGAQIFIFVDRIAHTDPLANLLKQRLGTRQIAATSSKDPQRSQKVRDFRGSEYRILVTTTILERGVTIPKSDVFVMDADGRLFDEASLVQMAGRAGRSALDPAGRVYFFARERNVEQLRALKHIRSMNGMAFKQGFLTKRPQEGKNRP